MCKYKIPVVSACNGDSHELIAELGLITYIELFANCELLCVFTSWENFELWLSVFTAQHSRVKFLSFIIIVVLHWQFCRESIWLCLTVRSWCSSLEVSHMNTYLLDKCISHLVVYSGLSDEGSLKPGALAWDRLWFTSLILSLNL